MYKFIFSWNFNFQNVQLYKFVDKFFQEMKKFLENVQLVNKYTERMFPWEIQTQKF